MNAANLADLLALMPNNMGLRVENGPEPDLLKLTKLFAETIQKEEWDKEKLYVVGMIMRPGASLYVMTLEHEHFVPETPANEDFIIRYLKWQEVMWFIAEVPGDCLDICRQVAAKTHMRVDKEKPLMIGSNGAQVFPFTGDNVLWLKNEEDSVVYEGSGGQQDARVEETMGINELLRKRGLK